MSITATYYPPTRPERFAPFGDQAEGLTHPCQACGVTVQVRRSRETGKRYVAKVETRIDWKGAYFRGVHTAEECQQRWEADYDNAVEVAKQMARQSAFRSFVPRDDLLNRWFAIAKTYGDVDRDRAMAAIERWSVPTVVYVDGTAR